MTTAIELELPEDLENFKLPPGVHQRLQHLLDKQDEGIPLSEIEQAEAQGLVDLSEMLSLLRLRAKHAE